jgi:hypothetical protein
MSDNPELESDITFLLDQAHRLHPRLHSLAMGQAIVEIAHKWQQHFSLVQIEQKLRERKSRIFIVALPIEQAPNYVARMPHLDEDLPFYLWFCVNGYIEYHTKLQEEHMSHEDNLARFTQSGMLVPKPNTDVDRLFRGIGNAQQN